MISRRVALRMETVEDVVAGRVGIEEAVRRFVELNRTDPRALDRVRYMYDGTTDDERAGWQLVSHLRAYRDPRAVAAADEMACRLAYPRRPAERLLAGPDPLEDGLFNGRLAALGDPRSAGSVIGEVTSGPTTRNWSRPTADRSPNRGTP